MSDVPLLKKREWEEEYSKKWAFKTCCSCAVDDYHNKVVVGAIKKINKLINVLEKRLAKEPCCKWNVPSDDYYCEFHKLVNKLRKEFGDLK